MHLRQVISRLAQAVIMLAGVSVITFAITRLSGDPTGLLIGFEASAEQRRIFRLESGLDDPLPIQYLRYAGNLARGDFGQSLSRKQPALPLVLERLPATLQLAAAGLAIAMVTALPLGVLAATRRNSFWDFAATGVSLMGQAIPSYWLGILLILLFPIGLGWLYTSGYGTLGHLVLPAVTVGAVLTARFTRLVRAGMLDVLGHDYIRTARSKGLGRTTILSRHAIRNALLPIITVLGIELAELLAGAVVAETIFAWPGLGRLAVQAISQRDYPVVQAVVLVSAGVYVLVNLLVDTLYTYLDPRVRYG